MKKHIDIFKWGGKVENNMTKDEWIKKVLEILYMIDTASIKNSGYKKRCKGRKLIVKA